MRRSASALLIAAALLSSTTTARADDVRAFGAGYYRQAVFAIANLSDEETFRYLALFAGSGPQLSDTPSADGVQAVGLLCEQACARVILSNVELAVSGTGEAMFRGDVPGVGRLGLSLTPTDDGTFESLHAQCSSWTPDEWTLSATATLESAGVTPGRAWLTDVSSSIDGEHLRSEETCAGSAYGDLVGTYSLEGTEE